MEMRQSCTGQRYEKDKKMPLVHPAKLLYTEERREWHTGRYGSLAQSAGKYQFLKGLIYYEERAFYVSVQ